MNFARRFSSPLYRHPDFLRLWAAQAGSAVGSRISRTALPIVAVLVLQSSNERVAWLSALSVLPAVVVGIFLSGAIERTNKTRVMVGSDVLRAGLLVLIPLAAVLGYLNIWLLDAVAFLLGAATVAFRVADVSFLPSIVPTELLVEGNSKLEATDAVAEAAGPALAGFLIELLGAPGAILLDATSYVWSALWLSRVNHPSVIHQIAQKKADGPRRVFADIVIGFRACAAEWLLAGTLAVELITGLASGCFMALYMLLALRLMAMSPAAIGLVISVGGISAFLGAVAAPALLARFRLLPLMVTTLVVWQAANILVAAAPSAGTLGAMFLVLQQIFGDGFGTIYVIYAVSARQRLVPGPMLARANGVFEVAAGITLPIGAILAGIVADHFGVQHAILMAGVLGLASAPVLLFAARRASSGNSSAHVN